MKRQKFQFLSIIQNFKKVIEIFFFSFCAAIPPIENKFNVTVTKVNLLNVKGKMKRGGKGKLTKRSDWKKAYISLKNEDRIEISQD